MPVCKIITIIKDKYFLEKPEKQAGVKELEREIEIKNVFLKKT
jgi:translation initiation factor IF-3